ncbi:MAG TPA: OsmC family protein [Anaerolineales bacterium]|nr:OsmC family protein [Anaerolineales bacterium]
MAVRFAEAVWNGGLRDGEGVMRFGSGAFEGNYTFASRFEEGPGTNPEELIGAALAGCFSMALSADLGRAGYNPRRIETKARVSLEQVDGKPTIARIHLETLGDVPGIEQQAFQEQANGSKEGCPVSRALTGVEISVEAKLVSG